MRFVALAAIRRVLACVALIGVCITPIESLIPDVHDGDATVATEAAGGMKDASSSHSTVPADNSSPSGQEHPFHMDHCSHSHCMGLGSLRDGDFIEGLESAPVDILRTAPASVSIPPHQRPPIA